MAPAYISHQQCQLHHMGPHHPEQAARLSAINDRLTAGGLDRALDRYNAPLVEREQLQAVHDAAHIEAVYAAAPADGLHWLDGDTGMNQHSLQAALRAAGAVVDILGGLNLVDMDYAWVTRQLCAQARRSAGGRIVSSLEGGYALHALARSVEAHLQAFLGDCDDFLQAPGTALIGRIERYFRIDAVHYISVAAVHYSFQVVWNFPRQTPEIALTVELVNRSHRGYV